MRKPDIYRNLNNGRPFLAWILNNNSRTVENRNPIIVDELVVKTGVGRYHEHKKIAALEMDNLLKNE
jgi:hypothetical protein